jgi:hypothetical protein
MYRRKILAIAILSGLAIGFFMMERSQIFAEEAIQDELQTLCDQLNEFKRYEGKKIGYDETLSPSWELGREIVKYKKEAIPYLLDIFQNSDNQIAQVFAARLIAEIDYDRGIRLLETQ